MALGGLTERLQFLITANSDQAIKEFKKTSDSAERDLGKTEKSVDKVSLGLQKWGAGAVVAGGLLGGALVKAAGTFEQTALAAGKFADATGLTVEEASKFIAIADDIGVDAGTIQTAFQKMEKAISANRDAFGSLVATSKDGSTDLTQTFLNVITHLQGIKDPIDRANEASKLFGKGFGEVAQLLQTDAGTIKTALAGVSDAQIINPAELQKARDYQAAVDNLGDSFRDIAIVVGQSAAPVLSGLANLIAGAVNAFQDLPSPIRDTIGALGTFGSTALVLGGSISFVAGKVIGLVGNLAALPPPLLAVGAAAGVATVAYGLFTAAKAKARAETEKFVAALKAEEEGNANATRFLIASKFESEEWSKTLAELGINLGEVADAVEGKAAPGFDALAQKVHAVTDVMGRTPQAAQELSRQLGVNGQDAIDLVRKVEGLRSKYADATDELTRHKAAQDAVTQSTRANVDAQAAFEARVSAAGAALNVATDSSNKYAGSADSIAQDVTKATDAINAQNDALNGLIDAELAAIDANFAVADATRNYNEALLAAKTGTDDQAQANEDLEKAALRVAQATLEQAQKQAAATGTTLDAKQKQDLLIGALGSLAHTGIPEVDAAIAGYITTLAGIPASKNTDVTTTGVDAAKQSMDQIIARLDRLGKGVNIPVRQTGSSQGGTRAVNALGTPFFEGGMTLVGEEGPELVTLPRGSKINTDDETRRRLGSRVVNNYSTVINAPTGVTAREIVAAQNRYAARNGSR